jgi:hypothetical protein
MSRKIVSPADRRRSLRPLSLGERAGVRGRRVAVAVLLLAAGVGCASVKVESGWDENVDFSKFYTWSWRPDGSISDPVWAKRVQDVLADELALKKLAPIDEDPDLWGVVHARLSSETEFVPLSPAWGYAWGAWAAPDLEVDVPIGTIIVDLVDARRKLLVWRGTATGALAGNQTNEQREEKLRAVLAQMFADYPPAAPAPAK